MAEIRHVAVIDIGKTNAKLALVDLATLAEVAVPKIPNRPRQHGPYLHHDVDALWDFILESLTVLYRENTIDAICVTTHGATAALLDAAGSLALPILDYEHDGPDHLRAEYDRVRPLFEETGSPSLPIGLNLGAQLFWQSRIFPEGFANAASILTYPQYWAFRLSGVSAGEVTSLGCHTDLWNPNVGDYSSLVDAMDWRALFPPLRPAGDRLGTILPEIAERTGLPPSTPVFCGIHDSNASLLPHLLSRKPPFAVVSTGTWVVSMAVGGRKVTLDPARDALINVDALGQPVPSARFMGGREFELLMGGRSSGWNDADLQAVLEGPAMLLPSVQQGCGPFPNRKARWLGDREPKDGQRSLAVSFYLALMTASCLEMVGAAGDIIVEGIFAGNEAYVSMLAAATGHPVLPQVGQATGTSIGAALLAGGDSGIFPEQPAFQSRSTGAWRNYARRWRAEVASAVG